MAAVSVHVPVGCRSAPVGEQNGDLVDGLGGQRKKIPEHIGVFAVGCRMALLCMDEIREFQGIADEERRRVVAHEVVIASSV